MPVTDSRLRPHPGLHYYSKPSSGLLGMPACMHKQSALPRRSGGPLCSACLGRAPLRPRLDHVAQQARPRAVMRPWAVMERECGCLNSLTTPLLISHTTPHRVCVHAGWLPGTLVEWVAPAPQACFKSISLRGIRPLRFFCEPVCTLPSLYWALHAAAIRGRHAAPLSRLLCLRTACLPAVKRPAHAHAHARLRTRLPHTPIATARQGRPAEWMLALLLSATLVSNNCAPLLLSGVDPPRSGAKVPKPAHRHRY